MIPYIYCPFCRATLTTRRIPALDPITGHEGQERRVCSVCGFIQWGNSKPTASAIIVSTFGQILLVKRRIDPGKGMWDVPGGFLETGEHPEEAVRREMREETGLTVGITRLIGIYMDTYASAHAVTIFGADNAPSEDTLNLYYECYIVEGIPKADDDAEELAWFNREHIPYPLAFKNAENAMKDFLAHTS